MNKNNLAIFDLDGTLFDTDQVNFKAYGEALESVGLSLSHEYFHKHCRGKSFSEFLPPLTGGNQALTDTIHTLKKKLYRDYLGLALPNRPLIEMAAMMKRNDYHVALATTASRENCGDILKRFGLENFFGMTVAREDVHEPKPSPEIFLKIMGFYNLSAERTIIFEDSPTGVEAARRSGASLFIVDAFSCSHC